MASQRKPMLTGLFPDSDAAERAYEASSPEATRSAR